MTHKLQEGAQSLKWAVLNGWGPISSHQTIKDFPYFYGTAWNAVPLCVVLGGIKFTGMNLSNAEILPKSSHGYLLT
jgi:hypothetical protein